MDVTTTTTEEESDKKKTFGLSTKIEFKSEFVGKTTHIKFEEKKPLEFLENKSDEISFEINLSKASKNNLTFYHENEDIMTESGKMKKYLKSNESNL